MNRQPNRAPSETSNFTAIGPEKSNLAEATDNDLKTEIINIFNDLKEDIATLLNEVSATQLKKIKKNNLRYKSNLTKK
jgi:site-specific DNA-adenine methylase